MRPVRSWLCIRWGAALVCQRVCVCARASGAGRPAGRLAARPGAWPSRPSRRHAPGASWRCPSRSGTRRAPACCGRTPSPRAPRARARPPQHPPRRPRRRRRRRARCFGFGSAVRLSRRRCGARTACQQSASAIESPKGHGTPKLKAGVPKRSRAMGGAPGTDGCT
eukprot:5236500-Prymnesium_polylepis.2